MIKTLAKFGYGVTSTGILMATFATTSVARAACDVNGGIASGAECANPETVAKPLFDPNGLFASIAKVLIFLVGAVSVIMLIIGGLRYVLSSGNASAVEGAKNTILYAIVGVIVAILSFAIIQFVISRLTT